MNFDRLILWKVLGGTLLAGWLSLSLISLNHLYPVLPFISQLSTGFIGGLGWCTAFFAIVFCGRRHLRELFVLALFFFILGFVLGPFLEPPADPLEHLRRVHELSCGKTVEQMPRENRGVWQYSMMGVVLCTDGVPVNPVKMLRKIDVTNGLFWALLAATIYILAIRAGLVGRWAFLSVLICFLFFGTNRFSYFRYYSLAPSFSSMLIFWLWTAIFFFRKNIRDTITGIIVALLSVPILWVNHKQEAIFLGFIVFVWIVTNIAVTWGKKSLFSGRNAGTKYGIMASLFSINGAGLVFLVIVCWLLPQFDFFLQWVAQFFIRDFGQQYQSLSVIWHGIYIGGRVGDLRVTDTLGGAGVLMLFFSVPYFWPGFLAGTFERKARIFILASLPFFGYFIPLLHFIWSSNVMRVEYYRLCYISMFWLFFADFFYSAEQRICTAALSVSFAKRNDQT